MSAQSITNIITVRAPEYAEEERLPDLIAMAMEQYSSSVLGSNYDTACALLVLHWLTNENTAQSAAGPLISEKEGDLSRTYARPYQGTEIDHLDSTRWGQELKSLLRGSVFPPMNRMSGYYGR